MQKNRTVVARLIRIVWKTIAFILLFIVLIFILLLTPPVQKFITGKVQNYLANKLHTKVLIGRIAFTLSGKIGLNNIYVEDKTRDTLLSGGSIRAHLNFLKLFSNEVRISDIEMQDITAKIKRVLPDTVYNFQFIVNAFVSESTKQPDTAASAPMKIQVSDVYLKNINVTYTDVIAGSDMFAHVGQFTAHIDTLDPYTQHFVIPTIILRNSTARMKQVKPLVQPKPLTAYVNEATTPSPMNLQFGKIQLQNINIDYGNDVSAFYTVASIGELSTNQKLLDLQNNKIDLDAIALNNSKLSVRLGKTKQAQQVKEEVSKETQAQKQAGWNVVVSRLDLNNNDIKFDDDNQPALAHGLDYSHLDANGLTLVASNFIMDPDSIAVNISKGMVNEKSGLKIEQLNADILYANDQSYLRNLYIKTPGTEIKRSIALNYHSLADLTKHPDQTNVQVELVQSRVQVKDILLFAPQLKGNPALRNPNDVWKLNIVGSGTMNQFNFQALQFAGLSNTQIDAHGSLTGLANPKNAGGNFVIKRFHTNQNDIALLSGQQLSNQPIALPQDITMNGTINGNAGTVNSKLNISTTDGFVSIDGKFSGLTNPATTNYNGTIKVNNLEAGKILKQQATLGAVSATMVVNGSGLTPDAINTKFSVNVSSIELNQYEYKNIDVDGSLHKTDFDIQGKIKDPNADANLAISGNFSNNPAFKISGMIDSIKTMPLHLTTEPLIVRGKIDGSASDLAADNPTANILLTQFLLVSDKNRLALDTMQILSGKNDTANYASIKSSIINANITGHYRLADLGSVIQNSIQPYFNTATASSQTTIKPYDFRFAADISYDPIFSAFVPGLTDMKNFHAEGSFSNSGGINASLTIPTIIYQGNAISGLKITANTSANGLMIAGNISHIKNGTSFDVYNTRLNADILNNKINFSLGIDDNKAKNKYLIAGLVSQPSSGTYTIKLKPDNLLLNYQKWTVSNDNLITILPDDITANNFILQNGDQRLSINSPADRGKQALQVSFSNFQLATITGFVKADSLLADGVINGDVDLNNFLQQPNVKADITIGNLSMQKDTIGNVTIHASTSGVNRYNADVSINGNGNDVSLKGWLATAGNDMDLNLDLNVRSLQLHSMEGMTAGALKNTSGSINGNVSIRGTANKPDINGKLNFDKSSFAITLLGSQFNVDGQTLSVTNDGLAFNNFTVKDSSGNALTLNGNVLTTNFTNYQFNLKLAANNFELLNSTKKDNPLYYGRMKINANLSITGTEVKPVVDGRITVNDGTALTFVVPQSDAGVESREGIVEFVDMRNPASDTLFTKYDSLNKASVLGMDISLNIEIKKEAIFNIIIDEANGDFLNAQGEALLTAGIDPSGKITMTGNYTLDKGSYQLTFNFLQRKFEIAKGSVITWQGEPTSASMNVTAMYVANTAPIDLVQDQVSGSSAAIRNTYMQKLPFEVHLKLTGELMKPVVGFDVILPQNKNYGVSNDVVATVEYSLAQLREDQGEMNKQVFSLLLLGRFVGANPFASASSGGNSAIENYARQSASKLLTEQLNNLAAGLIRGVDINFDVASTEDYTTGSMRNRTDLNVNVSKRLLNDRLKISVGSDFELEGPQNSNQQGTNIAGNVALDYQLSRDGRYMIRFFRKNEYEGELYGYVIDNGLSFIITVDYSKLKEIFQRRKQKVIGSPSTTDAKQKNMSQ